MSENGGTLTLYQRMPDQLEAVKVLGGAIAKSGMFGCGSIEAGMVFAAECMFRNMPPLSLAERYHVIFGKLSMKAEAMLAGFEQEGGTYDVITRTPDLVSIEMTPKGKKKQVLSLSWEDAQKEPFAYEGKEEKIVEQLLAGKKPPLKPKYATPRSRMQMLWARLISDSVRFLCPQVVSGKYTPEEIDDFEDSEVAAGRSKKNGSTQPKSATSASVVESAAPAPTSTTAAMNPLSTVSDAEFEKKPESDQPKPESESQPEFCTPKQRTFIESLFCHLDLTADQKNNCFIKRQASGFQNLSFTKAAELIVALENKFTALKAAQATAANAALPPIEPGNETLPAVCGPCTPEQEKAIKSKFEEWKQIDPENSSAAFRQLVQKLYESGRQKISDLSANDAAKLYDCIQVHNMASFFSRSLEEWKRPGVNQPAAEKVPTATSAAA